MIRGLSGLLAVAAVAGTGTAYAADEDTMVLGRFQPADTAKDDTKTLATTTDDDTALIRGGHGGGGFHGGGFHGGYYGGGFSRGYYGGGYGYGRSYYGGGYGYGRSYYGGFGLGIGLGYGGYGRGYYGGYYRPYYGYGIGIGYGGYGYYGGYNSYYPTYYSSSYYSTPGYCGAYPISGSVAATVPLQLSSFSDYLQANQPQQTYIPPAQSTPTTETTPLPMPKAMPDATGVRVSLQPAQPSKYKYAAYGEKQ